MFDIDFDETIASRLPPEHLWELVVEAFESPESSPIWPDELEVLELDELAEGTLAEGTYVVGPVSTRVTYRITDLAPGESFTYQPRSDHPLRGSATVAVEPVGDESSRLHWSGSYRPRRGPTGLAASLFVQLYFLRTFFSRLRTNLAAYETGHRRSR